MKKKQKIIAITGASSTGKTKLAIELAKELNGEIISVDSRQIYKELDIGSAKPTMQEREGIVHHLIDVTDLEHEYTAANYCDEAKLAISKIESQGKIPILAGGTGLYFKILLQDFDLPRVAPDIELRKKLEQLDSIELFERLKTLDFELSQKIHPNNRVKVIRALEVCYTLGIPMSKAQKKKQNPYDTLWIGLVSSDREFLYDRINKRAESMLKQGLLQEAQYLFKKYKHNNVLEGTIGYQEFLPFFNNEISLDEAIIQFKQNTRRYAKRQISWFKSNPDIFGFDIKTQSIQEIKEKSIQLFNEI